MNIDFSPPDITEREIEEVVDTLRSGWITTGPKTKKFERGLSAYLGTNRTVCLNSATAAMELGLHLLGVGPGDEVITTAYTYTASASVIDHVGAKVVIVDIEEDSFDIDYNALEEVINKKTKAIIPVDIGGVPVDYDRLMEIVEKKKGIFVPESKIQEELGRVCILADSAHSIGALYKGEPLPQFSDINCYSFHAVKNLTTAEGGAITWNNLGASDDYNYEYLQLLSLHGQNKDALSKMQLGSWEYDIVFPGYKCNMTDINASLGLVQLERYERLLAKRKHLVDRYNDHFNGTRVIPMVHDSENKTSSYHLYIVNIEGASREDVNSIIVKMAEAGVATNVHYKPLPMLTAYKDMGFDIDDYPNAKARFENVMTLPLHSGLGDEEIDYVAENLLKLL